MAFYYMPKPGQGVWYQLKRFVKYGHRPRPSFPRAIQIQTNSRCNARCLFCGYTEIQDSVPMGEMDEELFRKIVDECGQHWIGRISPYLMNEPLLDRRMPERIAYIHKVKKFVTKTKINSNGALLTADMSEGLVESGLRHLWISVQGYSEETYSKSMNLPLGKVLDNIDRFLDIRDKAKAEFPKLTVTTLRTALVEPELEYAKKYWAERNVRFKIHEMDNRSGKDLSALAVRKEQAYRRNCDLFLKQAYVLYNGDMILCCHDWRRTVVLGNLREQSLAEIWNSKHFLDLIHEYQAGNFKNLKICATCSVT